MKTKNKIAKKYLDSLIKEAVEDLLFEDYVSNIFTQNPLYKTFIEPFTDILKTAQHGAEKIMATTIGETKLLAKQLAFLFLPFLNPAAGSLNNMAAQDRKKIADRLSSIDEKFGDVLNRNWSTFNNPDVWGTLFLMHPQLAISQKLLVKAPEVALELLSVLTGNSEAVENILKSYKRMKMGKGGNNSNWSRGSLNYDSYNLQGYDTYDYYDDYGIYEQKNSNLNNFGHRLQPQFSAPQQKKENIANPEIWLKNQIINLLKKPEIQKQITNSKIAKAMQAEAINYIVKAAQQDLNFNFNDLKTRLGSNYKKIIEMVKAKILNSENIDIEKDINLQKKIVAEIKALLKPAYIKQLQSILDLNPNAKQLIDKAIQKINSI